MNLLDLRIIAKHYAKVLLVAFNDAEADELKGILETVFLPCAHKYSFRRIFSNPFLSWEEIEPFFRRMFSETKVNQKGMSFLRAVYENKRLENITEIFQEFLALYFQKKGEYEATVRTAVKLLPMDEVAVKTKLETLLKAPVNTSFKVDDTLNVGMRISVGPYFLDASFDKYVEALELSLRGN